MPVMFTLLFYLYACHVHFIVLSLCLSCSLYSFIFMPVMFTSFFYLYACHVHFIVLSLCLSCSLYCFIFMPVMFTLLFYLYACHVHFIVLSSSETCQRLTPSCRSGRQSLSSCSRRLVDSCLLRASSCCK